MKTLILYYSLTGTTAVVAKALATALNATTAEIQCRRYRSGWFRYLLVAYDSVKGRLPQIDVPESSFRDYDLVLLGTPVWTSYASTPLRSFLSTRSDLPDRVALFLTYGGRSAPGKAVQSVSDLLAVKFQATLELPHDTVVKQEFSELVDAFVAKLKSERATVPSPDAAGE